MLTQYSKFVFLLAVSVLCLAAATPAKIIVVASIPDLGSIASTIGGDNVSVSSITKADANPHSVEVFPSYMAKVSRATLYLKGGLALDQWADAIIDGSRNNHLVVVDCSKDVRVLDKPSGKVDASQGDVHPEGNPHYWLNPENGIVIAQNILAGLQKADPSQSAVYVSNFERFKTDCASKIAVWKQALKPMAGRNILEYHSSWVYFATAFGLNIVGHVEPFPGIPPTGKHLAELVSIIKKENVAFIIQEPYFPGDAPKFLNRQTGIPVLKLAPACQGVDANDYFAHFDAIVSAILKTQGGK
ncbi:MAG: metal ABC transporter substrate-binding protein [Fibrobacterota bacterium]